MADIVTKVSDISGKKIPEGKAGRLIVRRHPDFQGQRSIDIQAEDIADLKPSGDMVSVGIQLPNEPARELLVTAEEFRAVVSNEVLEKANGVRGRAPSSYR